MDIVAKALEFLWFWFSLGCTLLLFLLWILAYFSPTNEVILNINMFGESFIEMLMWIVFLGLGYYGAGSIWEKITK